MNLFFMLCYELLGITASELSPSSELCDNRTQLFYIAITGRGGGEREGRRGGEGGEREGGGGGGKAQSRNLKKKKKSLNSIAKSFLSGATRHADVNMREEEATQTTISGPYGIVPSLSYSLDRRTRGSVWLAMNYILPAVRDLQIIPAHCDTTNTHMKWFKAVNNLWVALSLSLYF